MILTGSDIMVTGGGGFLGSHIVDYLKKCKASVHIPRSRWIDFTDYAKTLQYFMVTRPEYVIHCAGFNGGIEFNRRYGADILYNNSTMALNIHKAAHKAGVKKIVSVITSCAYPDNGAEVITESSLWEGLPNETIRGHGIAKRMLQACAEQYHNQHGLDAVTAALTNLFGPRDTFNLVRTKVVGAVINKLLTAKMTGEAPEFWGTGASRREFMYVEDAAQALVQALFKYEDHSQPLNIGIGSDMSIKELVDTVADFIGYQKEIKWLTEKGDGQMKKLLNTDRMRDLLDVQLTPFSLGLEKTFHWYKNNKKEADKQ
jgi:nucleoside-diphosphate-sugar epimerase